MKHKFAVFIGRFSPYHLGHQILMTRALELADKVVVVLGSYNRAKNIKNPWTADQRKQMIQSTLSATDKDRVEFVYMKDFLYTDNLWIQALQNKISEATEHSEDVALIGHKSDSSSYYLDYFPSKWKYYDHSTDYDFHATQIRDYLFTGDIRYNLCVDKNVAVYLTEWTKTEDFLRLQEEFNFLRDYKEKWKTAPFPPTFITVDAVVIQFGHVLVVHRKGKYGQKLLALPGGFLEQNETIQEGMLRELKEETAIKVSKEELRKCIKDNKVFDHPDRSLAGRRITHAFLINLGPGENDLPKVKGSDDALKAQWLPLNEVFSRENEFFEDHYYIIQHFVMRG
jgi:bifunctional NMN adenylyltransferase/nudix hydrolase